MLVVVDIEEAETTTGATPDERTTKADVVGKNELNNARRIEMRGVGDFMLTLGYEN